jgi:hypothetical protein
MGERVVTLGASRASRPIADFLMVEDYQGPKAGKYYVDGNVAATGNGSPDHPFATLTEAFTASNAAIRLSANRWWARRNQIFVCGDGLEEDLTTIPEKCDVIGCGYDIYPFPRIIGHHEIAAIATTGAKGCRFINMGWICDDAGPLFTFPAIVHGLQFIGGLMVPLAAGSTIAISMTDIAGVVIDGVRIIPSGGGGLFAEGIVLAGTQGHEVVIKNCDIYATEGIHVTATATRGGIIKDNDIYATALTINDESGLFRLSKNRLVSTAGDDGTGTGGSALAVVCAIGLAVDNRLTCSGHYNAPYPIQGTLS